MPEIFRFYGFSFGNEKFGFDDDNNEDMVRR